MDYIRTFIALEIPEDLRSSLARIQQRFSRAGRAVRWVKPENIHLTIKFLGATTQGQVQQVCRIMDDILAETGSLNVTVTGLGAFPSTQNPKVLWVGLKGAEQFAGLFQRLDHALAAAGFAPEKRPFSPHITLGRVKDSRIKKTLRGFFDDFSDIHVGDFVLSNITFFKSDLQPTGPVYSVLKTIELQTT